jgi:hypothetical protein
MKPIKTQKQLEKRLKQLEIAYDLTIWQKEVKAINEFLEHNPGGITPPEYLEKISDARCLNGAWLYDRIQDKICTAHSSQYRGSLTKKIRKALGYVY